ncbi:MAG: class I SAM-dependent methyltransferase [Verrucomicrobia bacterium]|nr:class I SAM-dependent methyltransferase [Verrucomicrobiota bacterium]
MKSILEHNRRAWDERVRSRQPYIDTATDLNFQNPWPVVDPFNWLGRDVTGQRVLCLAAGGGRHGPLFAALGAIVTVVDLSPAMLALDRQVAAERGLSVNTRQGAMEDLSFFGEASFDIVVQPVSTCYTPDIAAVYRQAACVLKAGGLYISHHKQPASLQSEYDSAARAYVLREPYYRNGPLPLAAEEGWHREAGTLEYLHRWEELIGSLCRSGFVVEDLVEPRHADPKSEPGSFRHRSCFVPPFVAIKARRTAEPATSGRARIWTP